MARSHLTLAALATSAVPGADIVGTRTLTTGVNARFDSAVVSLRSGDEYVVRVPLSPEAETEQSLDLVALNALTSGVRTRLPFRVPAYQGQAPIGETRAVVYDYIPGTPATLADVGGQASASESIGSAIAAVHSLPTSVVSDAGLVSGTATQAAVAARKLSERAASTGKVPRELMTRWATAVDDSALWQFQPTVINGALAPESFLLADDDVVGIIGWSGLRVSDPAIDLFWLSSASRPESADLVYARYERGLSKPADRQLRKRARLYAELEIARWLLHGLDTRDDAVVDDAVNMLESLRGTVQNDLLNPLSTDTGQILAVEDVEAMLDRTPFVRDPSASEHANRISDD
jgi:aminoglycoside phosphotransferase (APT) family kinase protein